MKKNEIIAMQNRLEYLKDTVQRQRKMIAESERGLAELNIGLAIVLKNMALTYGGEDHAITIKHWDGLEDWKEEVTRDPENKSMTIRLYKGKE